MAYCTQADILKQLDEEILIQLTDDDGAGVVDSGNVDRAIADADEEMDGYLSVKYSLPFPTTPNLVRKISVDLAICNLYSRRDDTMPETRKDNCDKVVKMLDKLAKGTMKLDVPEPASVSDHGVAVTTSKSDRVFTTGKSSDGSTGTLDNY
jgi:phage gp36-like protein